MAIDDGPPGPRRRDPDAIDYSDESFGRYSYGEGRLAEEDYDPEVAIGGLSRGPSIGRNRSEGYQSFARLVEALEAYDDNPLGPGGAGYPDYDGMEPDLADDYYGRGMHDGYDRGGVHETFGGGLMDTYGRGINDTMYTEDMSTDYETLLMQQGAEKPLKRKASGTATFLTTAEMNPKLKGRDLPLLKELEEPEIQYFAPPFNLDSPEVPLAPAEDDAEWPRVPFRRGWKINWLGSAAMLFYILAFGFYLWVRITKTLDLGAWTWYGAIVLGVECLGASTTFLYGLNIVLDPVHEPLIDDPENPGLTKVKAPYHVRVLVPCYKESLEIVGKTIQAAYNAPLPATVMRTIYLCDDGKDPKKRKWCEAMGPEIVYVSGRKRGNNEMNGKSANLNNCLRQIYPAGIRIPPHELVCIFDADQVANPDFFLKMVPLFDAGDDVGMVLSPQCFYNLDPNADIFNHGNVQFWEYAQRGYDAFGFISCTGTNFLVRTEAFEQAGWSPEYTLTEDFALGMEMKKRKWQCRYVNEYLAVGEAPEQLRNCFQQRSRWCKGHFQIMLSNEHCPLFQWELSLFQRLMYCTGVWSYIVGAITTPMFIAIPLITIWAGVFPIVVSWWAAVGLTIYFVAQYAVMNYVHKIKDFKPLWFANVANSILWWTFVKACWRAAGSTLGSAITFKTTLKGANAFLNKSIGDLWMPVLSLLALLSAFGFGLYKVFTGPTVISTLSISLVWILYNAIPPYLLLHYNFVGKGQTLRWACTLAYYVSGACGIAAIVLLWLVYPAQYDYGDVMSKSFYFYDTQRIGTLPQPYPVPWRASAFEWEHGNKALGFGNLTGGFMTGGGAGTVKLTLPIAFSTSMLAWGILEFPAGYKKSNQTLHAMDTLRWGTDYLLKTFAKDSKHSQGKIVHYNIVYQVGNYTVEKTLWDRPESYTNKTAKRPAYFVTTKNGTSDLVGQIIGALVSTAMVFQDRDPPYSERLMDAALKLYGPAVKNRGRYTRNFIYKCAPEDPTTILKKPIKPQCPPPDEAFKGAMVSYYNSTSYRDDLAWAAGWMYRFTRDPAYLNDAYTFWTEHVTSEGDYDQRLVTDWDNMIWPASLLLAELTDDMAFHDVVQGFLAKWLCTSSHIFYTDLGRAYNVYSPSTGTTMNTALLSVIYGNLIQGNSSLKAQEVKRYTDGPKSQRYICWTRKQMRYMLGDKKPSLVVGWGNHPPQRPADRSSSCPVRVNETCNALVGLYNPKPNPKVLKGALIMAPRSWDYFEDNRLSNDTWVGIEQNAAFTGALAGLNEVTGTYDQCLQGYGILSRDKVICDSVVLN